MHEAEVEGGGGGNRDADASLGLCSHNQALIGNVSREENGSHSVM